MDALETYRAQTPKDDPDAPSPLRVPLREHSLSLAARPDAPQSQWPAGVVGVCKETRMDDTPAPDALLRQSLAVLRQCVSTLETAAALASPRRSWRDWDRVTTDAERERWAIVAADTGDREA